MIQKTIIQEFVERKIETYKQPKGGHKPRKFKTIASSLAINDRRDLAEKVDVSYEVIRKWYQEPRFRETQDRLQEEFANEFIVHVRERLGENQTGIAAGYRACPGLLPVGVLERLYLEISDFDKYTSDLKNKILIQVLNTGVDNFFTFLISILFGEAGGCQVKGSPLPMVLVFTKKARELLLQNHISVRDRKFIRIILETIEQYIKGGIIENARI
ncbi:MAG: hypothetical protein ACUZ8H_15730 [Candidatus Anammoxibacter sp.]